MNSNLTPGISTHFRCVGCFPYLTRGNVYKILEWETSKYYIFLDDLGERTVWFGQYGVEDYTFQAALKTILE